jgi:hypothetical protein
MTVVCAMSRSTSRAQRRSTINRDSSGGCTLRRRSASEVISGSDFLIGTSDENCGLRRVRANRPEETARVPEPVREVTPPGVPVQRASRCRHRQSKATHAWVSSTLVGHVPKSAKHMPIVEFGNLEIRSAAERYRTSMAKYFPKPLRTLYRGGRARALNGFTSGNAAINEIAGHSHERSDLCHRSRPF